MKKEIAKLVIWQRKESKPFTKFNGKANSCKVEEMII